ncbi:MAG: HD domain-containing phosphohydrolase [Candidatus Acetothermia bacterium]
MENTSFIHRKEEYIDRVAKTTTDIRLLARHNSLEIMKQKIAKGSNFYLDSAEEWQGFEFIYILRGEIAYTSAEEPVVLEPGDYIARHGVHEESWFEARVDTRVLVTSSQPAFYLLREEIEDYLQLAEEIESTEQMDGHSKRLVRMSHEVGKRLGLDTERLADLKYASFFHDLGKAKVPDRILEKEGSLTDEEWEIMEKHTVWGREMLEGPEQLERAGKIVEQTHERFDGGGYPKGLSGEDILLEARIVTVVDSWDAMRSDRPYRDALTEKEAVKELRDNKGSQFDPEVVDTFMEVLRGSDEMELDTQARGKYKEDITKSNQSEKLFRFSKEIQRSETIEEVMERTLDAVVESTAFQRALISIFDRPIDPEDPGPARVKHYGHRGLSPEHQASLEEQDLTGVSVDHEKFAPEYKLGGVYYLPHEERRKKIDSKVEISSTMSDQETLDWHPDDSLYVPLYRGDKIIGQISVDDPEHGLVPDPESLQPLESFASISSMGVENTAGLTNESPDSEGSELDQLTGLYSRGYFNRIIQEEMDRGEKYSDTSVTFLMFDLSGFKEVNSRHSHLKGDEVLIEIAGLLKENFPAADLIVRYGNDEFLLVFPELEESATVLKDRLTDLVDSWNRETDLISVELGVDAAVSTWEGGEGAEIKDLLHRTEKELDTKG